MGDPGGQLKHGGVEKDMDVYGEDGRSALSTGPPESGSGPRPEMVPAPGPPSLSAQLPSLRVTMDTQQHLESPSIENAHRLKLQGRTGPSLSN